MTQSWEEKNGRIPDGAIVLLNTGLAQYYPDKLRYTGTMLAGAAGVENLHSRVYTGRGKVAG